jgi:hypothetical protein
MDPTRCEPALHARVDGPDTPVLLAPAHPERARQPPAGPTRPGLDHVRYAHLRNDVLMNQNRLRTLSPIKRGSKVKTLVERPVSSELRKAPVTGVSSNTFLT